MRISIGLPTLHSFHNERYKIRNNPAIKTKPASRLRSPRRDIDAGVNITVSRFDSCVAAPTQSVFVRFYGDMSQRTLRFLVLFGIGIAALFCVRTHACLSHEEGRFKEDLIIQPLPGSRVYAHFHFSNLEERTANGLKAAM